MILHLLPSCWGFSALGHWVSPLRRSSVTQLPDDQYQNQIDYILWGQRWKSSIQSAKTRLGADCGSYHELLIAKFRLNLKKVGKTTRSFSSSSVAQSCLTLRPYKSQHTMPPSITNSRSLLKLMSIESVMPPVISSSVFPFSCPQSFPASGSFPMSQLFSWGGQSIGVSASTSVLPMNTRTDFL